METTSLHVLHAVHMLKGIVDILHAAGLAGGSAEALDVVDDGLAVVGFRVDEGDEVGQ